MTKLRIGHGYDIHRLTAGRRCVLGGVEIPSDVGPDGHSDADVLIHAIMDALLGAASLGDIGQLFPNTDAKWKDVSSLVMLQEVCRRVRAEGWEIVNVDSTLVGEKPRVMKHAPEMARVMAAEMGLVPSQIGIKATTNEGLGAIGRNEGIAAFAVALLTGSGGTGSSRRN
ncbi:MAG: 2-C-methyl-D-erythritol 2,4-cyclodiphosphate synthase [Deltaproteobacteria bacterium]|nr:2-C-methyl-D-erythritol 2,4-cyclodiphosphate synthase [Deltaproteobacteria bacterium]